MKSKPKLTWPQAGAILLAATVACIGLHSLPVRPLVNLTTSEPRGLYWVSLFGEHPPTLRLHELVAFHYLSPPWAKGRYYRSGAQFLKEVGAMPGTWLFTKGLHQYACSSDRLDATCRSLGTMLPKDPKGRLMHWPKWHGYQIPPGEYYMQATLVPTSYDSRYYGLVSVAQLIGSARPIWTFGK